MASEVTQLMHQFYLAASRKHPRDQPFPEFGEQFVFPLRDKIRALDEGIRRLYKEEASIFVTWMVVLTANAAMRALASYRETMFAALEIMRLLPIGKQDDAVEVAHRVLMLDDEMNNEDAVAFLQRSVFCVRTDDGVYEPVTSLRPFIESDTPVSVCIRPFLHGRTATDVIRRLRIFPMLDEAVDGLLAKGVDAQEDPCGNFLLVREYLLMVTHTFDNTTWELASLHDAALRSRLCRIITLWDGYTQEAGLSLSGAFSMEAYAGKEKVDWALLAEMRSVEVFEAFFAVFRVLALIQDEREGDLLERVFRFCIGILLDETLPTDGKTAGYAMVFD